MYNVIRQMAAGKHVELNIQKVLYDPMYGLFENIKDFPDEYRAVIEDKVYDGVKQGWFTAKVVGTIDYAKL